MLIVLPEHEPRDLEAWRRLERADPIRSRSSLHLRRVDRSKRALADFVAKDSSGYCGVSWGKDSVVVAHLVVEMARNGGPVIPLVWVRVEPAANPHCSLVRDAFLSEYPHQYDEITTCLDPSLSGPNARRTRGGFNEAARRYGDRHISGVRASESSARTRRCAVHGESTARTCAPLAWWEADDVYAYLWANQLPVHPAYAMSLGGKLDRGRLRVSSIGGERGTGMGRREWERLYYPDKCRELGLL